VTDKAAGKKGIFVLPRTDEHAGIHRRAHRGKMGQKPSDTAQILFENCRGAGRCAVGCRRRGYKIALSNLEAGRMASPRSVSAWREQRWNCREVRA